MFEGQIHIHYPLNSGTMVLRTERDWEQDIEPFEVDKEKHTWHFYVSNEHNNILYKSCIRDDSDITWEEGNNRIAVLDKKTVSDIYPVFGPETKATITDILRVPSEIMKRDVLLRVYLPAGYDDNPLAHFPVVYMHDGKNLFFPDEAFLGREWTVDENLDLLDRMNLVDPFIVVGVYADDREFEYTKPGYEIYGKSLVEEIKPWIDENFRTSVNPWDTCVMGSSLGGVVSFYLGWEYPETFGSAICLSSTFGWKDDLMERIETEPIDNRKNLRIYLDSGWPGDNYERNARMIFTLISRGFKLGQVIHLAFPHASHDEYAWASRLHIPFQLFAGKVRRTGMHQNFPESKTE